MTKYANKTILITGGAGFIKTELTVENIYE